MRTPIALAAVAAGLFGPSGSGCAVVYEEPVDSGARGNHAPWISDDTSETYWKCAYDEGERKWYFEFQAWVDDPEGYYDVKSVYVEFFTPEGGLADAFDLNYERDGVWGGWVWEGEAESLYCGDPYDARFVAEDERGARGEVWVRQESSG